MIVTVTPNPSFDRTVRIETLHPGEVHRASNVTIEAGGKGVNVARAVALSGAQSICVFPGHPSVATPFLDLLGPIEGFEARTADSVASIRTNTTVIETDGRTTKLNEPGDALTNEQQEQLIAVAVEAANGQPWVAVCGSLPPGVEASFASRIRERLAGDTKVAIDASGAALAAAVEAGCELVKPNAEELADLIGRPMPTLGDVIDAATEVHGRGVETVVVSLGGDGAILVDADGVVFGQAPASQVQNTVGAGDAFLAGFLSAGGSGSKALYEALAWGRAAVASASTAFPPATDEDRAAVVIATDIDRALMMEG